MATVKFSWLVGLHPTSADHGTIGLLVWVDEEATFFAVEGREHVLPTLAQDLRGAPDRAAVIEYLLDRGTGGYRSFSVPEEIEARSLRDSARLMARAKRIALAVPDPVVPRCSSCGSAGGLDIVTLRYGDGPSGRLMVYCGLCSQRHRDQLGVCVPIGDATVDSFVALYREGKTQSDPAMAAGIVFGEAPIDAVRGATAAMEVGRQRGDAS